jgi:hypothetical protein
MNKIVTFIVGLIIGALLLFGYTEYYDSPFSSDFKQKTDSLNKVIDSLHNNIVKEDSVIDVLVKKDSILVIKVEYYKSERDVAKAKAKDLASKFKTANDDELAKFYIERYAPESPLAISVPKEALMNAAQDLILCDGTKAELALADSAIITLNDRITGKDSVISSQNKKEANYNSIILNQDLKYGLLENESKSQINKLKKKILMWKTTTGLVVLGSILLIL